MKKFALVFVLVSLAAAALVAAAVVEAAAAVRRRYICVEILSRNRVLRSAKGRV